MKTKYLSISLLLIIFNVLGCGVSYAALSTTVKNETCIYWNVILTDQVAINYCKLHNYNLKTYRSNKSGSNITTLLLEPSSTVTYDVSKNEDLIIFSNIKYDFSEPSSGNTVKKYSESERLFHRFPSADQFVITVLLHTQLINMAESLHAKESYEECAPTGCCVIL